MTSESRADEPEEAQPGSPSESGENLEPAFDATLEVSNMGLPMPKARPEDSVPGGQQTHEQAPTIPDVTIVEILGTGGQGTVFRGHQEFLNRDVAVKVLHKSVDCNLARFRQEATLLARLQHPNIVACYQAGVTEEEHCYMVLEFVDGQDLYQHVREKGALSEDSALALVADIALGLKHGYETNARMIHRDVKPQNVLLKCSEEGPGPKILGKIVDLGLARCLEESMELTRVGAVMGTPVTMAPEQYDEPEAVDHRTDIYGLGCVLFFAMTGDPAFKGATFTAIYRKKMAKDSAQPHRDLDLSPGTKRLLDTMLAREQGKRPATYEVLLEQIREARADLKKAAKRPRWKSSQALIGAAAAAAAVAVIVVVWAGSDHGEETSPGDIATGSVSEPASALASSVVPDVLVDPSSSTAAAGGPSPMATVPPALVGPPLSPMLPTGASLALFHADQPFVDWWPTAEGPGTPLERRLWRLRGSRQLGTTGLSGTLPTGQPFAKFEDEAALMITPASVKERRSPEPFFVPGASAISHGVPAGNWGLRGRMALQHEGAEDYLLAGWALRRRDGSFLEVAQVVSFPEGSDQGLNSKRWALVRAAWFKEDGTPYHANSSAETLKSTAPGDLRGEDAATRLCEIFMESNSDPVRRNDVFVADFNIRIGEDAFTLLFGDECEALGDLPIPRDFKSNGFCELIVYSRSGYCSLRDWSLFGL